MKKFLLLLIFCATHYIGLAQTPAFTSTPLTSATVGSAFSYTAAASDGANALSFTTPTLPSWLRIANTAVVSTLMTSPAYISSMVADAQGGLYINSGSNIYKVNPNGTSTLLISGLTGDAYDLHSSGGFLYVPQLDGPGGILKFDLSNVALPPVSILPGVDITGLAEKNGFLYASAYNDIQIYKIDLNNNTSIVLPISGLVNPPAGLAFDHQGRLLITDQSSILTVWDGTTTTSLNVPGLFPWGIDVDANGYVYLLGNKVRRYSPDFSDFQDFGKLSGNFDNLDLAITADGGIFAGDANTIQKITLGAPSLAGTPTVANIGVHSVVIRADNGAISSDQSFTITVLAAAVQNNALSFNGTNNNNVTVNSAVTPFNFGTGDFTLEAWINTADINAGNKVIIGDYAGGSDAYWIGMNPSHQAVFSIGGTSVVGTSIINDGKWHHITGAKSGTNILIYIDGKPEANGFSSVAANPNGDFTIGNIRNGDVYPWLGAIDEVRVYNAALSPANVLSDMTSTSPALPANLVSYFDFNQGIPAGNNTALTTLTDSSPNAFTATLNNFDLTAGNTTSNYVGSYALVIPTATAANAITLGGFTANWTAPSIGTVDSYRLDVATDANFTGIVQTLTVASGTSQAVTGLTPYTNYFYRVRAFSNTIGEGVSSNAIAVSTSYTPPGNALDFKKAGANVVPIASANFPSGNSSYTVEAWINPDNLATVGNGGIIGWGNYGTNNEVNALRFDGGPGNYRIRNYWWANDISAPIPDVSGKWTHVAASFDQGTGARTIYINGQLIFSDNPSQVGHNVASTNITIGKTVGTEYFDGKIDEVRIYNGALSQANIQADMYNTTSAMPGNLVAYYNFDQGIAGGDNTAITSVRTSIPGNNVGTLQGFTKNGATSNFVGTGNYPMEVPVAATADNLTDVSFSANWSATTQVADNYFLDVATDVNFTSFVAGYNNKSVAGITDAVNGLTSPATYYYRVRAYSAFDGLSANSSTITATVKTTQTLSLTSPNAGKTYGDADFMVGASSSNTTIPITYTTSDASVAIVATDGTVHIVGAGSATITANQTGDATYAAANPVTFNLTIAKKALTIAATGVNKIYDQTNAATVSLSDDRVTGDVFTASYTTATFLDKMAGTAKPITVSGISLPAGAANNYTFNTTASATANITPKTLTVSATGIDKMYDGNTGTLVNLSDDRITGDLFTVNAVANFSDKNVGAAKPVNVTSISLSGFDANNYTPNATTATTASITLKPITVTATAGQTKVYGLADPVFAYTTDVPPAGTDAFTGALTRATGENIGTYAIALGNLTLGTNYTITFVPANFSITAKAIAVTADPKTKVYGDANPAVYTYTNTPLAFGDAFTGALSRTTGENAGTYAINQNTLALSSNYTVTYTPANLTITKKALTITADDKTKFQGTANPALTASYTGFITGESSTNLLTQATLSTTANTASPQGAYPIVAIGATSNNYTITLQNGTLTVTAGFPTGLTLAPATLYENRAAGTGAGTFSSTSQDPGATFTYTLVTGTGSTDNGAFSISGNQLLTAQSFDFETKNAYNIRVRTTTQYGLSLEQTFTVNISDVNEVPTLSAVADQAICYVTGTQSVALAGITAGPETAQSTTISVSSNNPNLFATLSVSKTGTAGTLSYSAKTGASGTATVTVTVQDNGGTANSGTDTFTRTFTITVFALPTPSITSNKGNSVGKGETIQLTVTGGTSYVWAANSGIVSGQNTAVLTVRPSVTTTYTVTATNANGCSESTSFTIAVESDYSKLKSTNILTPNNDGFNDKWVITNIDLYGNNEAKVFDKAGRLVYSKKNYDNSWDGTFNGVPLSEDTYYYIVDFGPGKGRLKGFITIIREQ